jgi:carbon storage regulator CsrA
MKDRRHFAFRHEFDETFSILCLSRGYGQGIRIGDDIELVLYKKRGADAVQVIICAPRNMQILRSELFNYDDEASSQ